MTTRLSINQYNVGAQAGNYALKDMSNTGKFSNTIQSLPVRVSYELDAEANLLTIKEGTHVTIPYGFSIDTTVDHYKPILEDVVINLNDIDHSSVQFIVYNENSDEFEIGNEEDYIYAEADIDGYSKHTFVKKINKNVKCSLPIGYIDTDGTWHAFTAIGFYNNIMWVDAGVNYLIPDGRTEDYTLNVLNVMLDKLAITTIDELLSGSTVTYTTTGFLLLDTLGSARMSTNYTSVSEYEEKEGYIYVTSENKIFDSHHVAKRICKIADVKVIRNDNGSLKFGRISNFNVFQTLDFSEVTGSIADLQNGVLYKDGRAETMLGQITFSNTATFNGATNVTNANLTNANVTNLNMTDGIVDFNDAKLVNTQEANCLNIVGKTASGEAGIILGSGVVRKRNLGTLDEISYSEGEKEEGKTYLIDIDTTDPNLKVGDYYYITANRSYQLWDGYEWVVSTNGNIKIYGKKADSTITVSLPYEVNGEIRPAIMPETGGIYDIGSEATRFRNIYATSFEGVATKAKWADLAEIYKTDAEYPIGTLLQFGGKAELTIAHSEVNAVVSDKPAFLMNAEAEGQPVALAGRVKVRIKGTCKKHDKIYLSQTDGLGTNVGLLNERPIARALEDKLTEDEGLVLCAVHFNI